MLQRDMGFLAVEDRELACELVRQIFKSKAQNVDKDVVAAMRVCFEALAANPSAIASAIIGRIYTSMHMKEVLLSPSSIR